MSDLKFDPDYGKWKRQYDTEPVYTRRQMAEAIENCVKAHTVNRVIKSFDDRVGPECSAAMMILAVHKTPEGITVIVK